MGVDGSFVCPGSLSWFNTWSHRAVASALPYSLQHLCLALSCSLSIPLCWRTPLCDGLDIKPFLPLALVTELRQLRKPRHACCCSLPQWTCSLEEVRIDWWVEKAIALKPVLSLSAVLYKRWQLSSLALEKKLDKMQRLWREAVILQQFWAAK